MNLFEYCLSIFFVYFLINYAEITRPSISLLFKLLPNKVSYSLNCAFCLMFWISIICCVAGYIPVYWIFCAPVIHLVIDLIYTKLSS